MKDEAIRAGQVAAIAKGETSERLWAQQLAVIDRLINSYRGNKLTGDQALCGIAELAALDTFRKQLEKEIKQGQDALAETVNHGYPV